MSGYVDCQEILAKLYEYIDGELGELDREVIAEHLEKCRPCLSQYEVERLFNEYVVQRTPRPEARTEFKERLFTRLAEERALVPGGPGGSGDAAPGHRFFLAPFRAPFALAAVLVLGFGLGATWLAKHEQAQATEWALLSGFHHETANTGEEMGLETDDFAAAKAFVANHLGQKSTAQLPADTPEGLKTHASCILRWRSTRIAQFEFETAEANGEHDLSLFVIPAAEFPTRQGPKVRVGSREYQTAVVGCCRAVSWDDGGGQYCTIMGDQDIGRLLNWAESWEALHGGSQDTGRRMFQEDHGF